MKNVIVIGGGISGLTASLYLKRANINVKVFCNYSNGMLTTTPFVENFPGFPNGISGCELLDNMVEQNKKIGVQILDNEIIIIDHVLNKVIDDQYKEYNYDALIYAAGTSHKELDFVKDSKFINIHYCATCDGAMYKDKIVAVVGGGNTALTESIYLSNIVKKVYLIHRRNEFRADKILVDKIKAIKNVELILNQNVKELIGSKNKFDTITFVNNHSNINVNGIFIAVGLKDNIQLLNNGFTDKIKIQDNKVISTDGCKNIFVCGDINNKYKQAVIAAGDGAKTALKCVEMFSLE